MLETTEKDAKYDTLKSSQKHSNKAKNVLRGAGYARGGGVGAASGMKSGGAAKKMKPKKHGEKMGGDKPKSRPDKMARGGSEPKGHHTRVNINVGAGQAEKQQAMQMGMQMGAKLAAAKLSGAGGAPGGPRPMGGAPMQARPMPPAPGGAPGGGPPGVPPTMANRGGRMYARGGKIGPKKVAGVTNLSKGGAGGGEGRLEKARKYGAKVKK